MLGDPIDCYGDEPTWFLRRGRGRFGRRNAGRFIEYYVLRRLRPDHAEFAGGYLFDVGEGVGLRYA